ncbi:MAG: hypothetical protein QNJ94_06045 [Alphaproteobacteria bacterium]|nr:hypothetical protein [Alphaproteobacteria bacterium]
MSAEITRLTSALVIAAEAHADQRRKGADRDRRTRLRSRGILPGARCLIAAAGAA